MKYPVIFLTLLTGCATTLSPEAEKVRIITSDAARLQNCKHLAAVASSKSAAAGGMPSAHVEVRNKAAKAGGNALAITSQVTSPDDRGDIAGDAYACPF